MLNYYHSLVAGVRHHPHNTAPTNFRTSNRSRDYFAIFVCPAET